MPVNTPTAVKNLPRYTHNCLITVAVYVLLKRVMRFFWSVVIKTLNKELLEELGKTL